ncbi:MAG: DNA repair protein RadA [Anaerolineae bacterium]|nr:DNA repair protein RadA [Anaerolineae bacterium]
MAKTRTKYVCQNCGYQSPKGFGRCPNCGEFNTMVEEAEAVAKPAKQNRQPVGTLRAMPQRLSEVSSDVGDRLYVPVEEFNRVLGGGLVPGSIILLGGEPGIGKCVVGSTRILDPESGAYRPITEWAKDKKPVLSLDTQTLKLTPDAVSDFHKQGVKPVFKITTKLGRTLLCTANHPLLTPTGWKPVEDLAAGSCIAAPRSLPYFGNKAMPDAEVKLIAYILSDGSVGNQINITNMLPEVAEEMEEIANAFKMKVVCYDKKNTNAKNYRFANNKIERAQARKEFAGSLRKVKSEVMISWAEWARQADVNYGMLGMWQTGNTVPSESELQRLADAVHTPIAALGANFRHHAQATTPMMRFLEQVGLRYTVASTKSVPDCIFTLPQEQLALFLNRLFTCDGSVYYNAEGQAGISYSTISPRLAEDVQHLLLRFGFISKLRTKHSLVNGKPYIAYEIQLLGINEIKRFLDTIGILGREKAREFIADLEEPKRPSTHRDIVPTGEIFWTHLRSVCGTNFAEITRRIGTKIKDRRHERPLTRYLVQKIATAYPDPYLQALAFGDVYWDEIVSITPSGEEEVYDISVPVNANFVANDLIIHNSTILLGISALLSQTAGTVLYVSGEESARQIKMRADRMHIESDDLYLLTETNLTSIFEHVQQINPTILVIDSIQTTYIEEHESSPGSVTQVRECASRLQHLAKSSGICVFLVGHVTKEGSIAGPRVLEHIVDTVLYLEGDPFQAYRLLRSVKNRFGATSEVGVFEMAGDGMTEVPNPSEAFLAERVVNAPGSAIAVTMEGTRPLLVEMQALTSPTSFGNPRRTPNGVDINRLLLISAVLSKRVGLKLHEQDIFVNVIGGMKVSEPATDLAMAAAMASSYYDKPVPADLAIVGEVGLSGEIRAVGQLTARLHEAAKLGFKRVLIPKTRRVLDGLPPSLKLIEARNVAEALAVIMPKE